MFHHIKLVMSRAWPQQKQILGSESFTRWLMGASACAQSFPVPIAFECNKFK